LTVNNSGALTTSNTTITVAGLTLGGTGNVGNFTGNFTPIQTAASSLTLAKTGGNVLLSNSDPLSISGTATNGDVNIQADGAIAVTANLNVGTGTLRLQSGGGISQSLGTIVAGALSVHNIEVGNIVLSGANAIGTFAGANELNGTLTVRSDVSSFTIGNVTGAGIDFAAQSGITTGIGNLTGGNITVSNPIGSIIVNQPIRVLGAGNGTVFISGATTINSLVTAAANRTVTIAGFVAPPVPPVIPPVPPPPPPIDLTSDTIIKFPLTTGNATITASRDVIVNAPVTATSSGGLAITADTDSNGSGGVLITGAGSLTASSLTAPLTVSGASLVNLGNFGGTSLGAGNVFYMQSFPSVPRASSSAFPSASGRL
jgi:hypothetical protein